MAGQPVEHYKNLSLEDIDGEIWLPMVNSNGWYLISNKGRIKRLPRKSVNTRLHNPQILKGRQNHKGYIDINLMSYRETNQLSVKKSVKIHRMVAMAFILNPKNLPQVNHKNGIKWDNRVENLEWVTGSENVTHSYRVLGANCKPHWLEMTHKRRKRVVKLSLDFVFIEQYESMNAAAIKNSPTQKGNIRRVCKGKKGTCSGFRWLYYEDYLAMITDK